MANTPSLRKINRSSKRADRSLRFRDARALRCGLLGWVQTSLST